MQFETPQYIDVEDKIFGPLSWRQFLYLLGGIGIAVALFFIAPTWVFIIIGLPVAVLGLALAFYPVNNRPFSFFLEAIFSFLFSDKLYLWRQRKDIVYKAPLRETNHSNTPNPEPPQTTSRASARELELLEIKE